MVTATLGMAIELAPFGVRVNAINPVAGETPLLKTFMGEDTAELRAKFSIDDTALPILDPSQCGKRRGVSVFR